MTNLAYCLKHSEKICSGDLSCSLFTTRTKKNIALCSNDCEKCKIESLRWLSEEHEEPIKLKQWEYDLLDIYTRPSSRFSQHELLLELSAKGHFEGVTDILMTVQDILDNCEVVE